ncbi:MAG: sigma-70 family RNA polymerase sigma factor [Hyphomicrobiaceae bacterium]
MPSKPSHDLKQEFLAALPNLRAFAYSLVGSSDRADDLVQDTMMKAWKHLDRFEEGTNLKAWLFTIMRNTLYSDHRRRRREVSDTDGTAADRLAVHPNQESSIQVRDLMRALGDLPIEQREAILLVGAEGLSYDEAATVCGCAIGTIKSRVNRARKRLAELMGMDSVSDIGPDGVTASVLVDGSSTTRLVRT